MKSHKLIDCNKCSFNSDCKQFGAVGRLTHFKSNDSRSDYLFRRYSVASFLVTSLILCRAAVLWLLQYGEHGITRKPLVATPTIVE